MSVRRQVRLRKEYLYRKGLEGNERAQYEKKALIRRALADGKALPTEVRGEEEALRHEIELEDDETAKVRSHADDEYAQAGHRDPRVCVTTSREPSSRLKQFAKELKLIVPNAQRINRGNYKVSGLIDAARQNDFTDVVVVQETRGEPDGLLVCHLPLGPTAYFTLSNCVLRHDIPNRGTMSEAYPHMILHGFSTALGARTADILKYLFPVPKPESKRAITFANDSDFISFRHHVWERKGGSKEVTLKEVGPRFEMQLYQIKLGTVDQLEADNEWVLRPYMNSAKRRRYL
ncbi:anticodon-binding protein [Tribonema minus]|uniref:Anticodon-binding protein n=1 Tax=Tribonema minus TaxID=303371 RepID=A0A835ZEG9_9STRA|nr:anticodon-binding protein [Tribonema minus]